MKSKSCLEGVSRVSRHDLAQPLNVIRLATRNIHLRTLPKLSGAEADYLATKLERIERQVDRAAAMIERLHDPTDYSSQQGN